jgi:hypothetical protein
MGAPWTCKVIEQRVVLSTAEIASEIASALDVAEKCSPCLTGMPP